MITITANARRATFKSDDLITSGSVGIPVVFVLSDDFDGLSSIAVFEGSGTSVDVALMTDACVVPPEVVATAGGYLRIGVYARNGEGTIVIPTVWVSTQVILPGAEPSGVDPSQPTPDWTAQVQAAAAEALSIAQNVADLSVASDTLAPGSSATVAKSVDPDTGAITLSFGIPRGDRGEQGPQGERGVQGEVGPAGPRGHRGIQGLRGERGPQGIQGIQGPQGERGETGPAGPQGERGETGEQGPQGVQGETGPKGDTGATGPAGPQGSKGDPGDVQSVAGKTGAVTLDAGDVSYNDQQTYTDGTVGAGLADLKSHFDNLVMDSTATGIDLDIADSNGNVIGRFAGGNFQTKNFNSANVQSTVPTDNNADFGIADVNGNLLVEFVDGQIKTKNFRSEYIRQLMGKKWTCLGDSLTEHNLRTTMNYHDYIADETGITVYNLGHSGCGYAKVGGNGQTFADQAANIPNDTDVITIFGSGNDKSSGLDLGTATDTGTTTICGCINATLDVVYANHPTIPLGVITPTPWASSEPSDGVTAMSQYCEKLIEICNLRGIPCLDLYHCSNLHPTDTDFRPLAYSHDDGDGVHPDETGHAIIAPRIRQFLFSLI